MNRIGNLPPDLQPARRRSRRPGLSICTPTGLGEDTQVPHLIFGRTGDSCLTSTRQEVSSVRRNDRPRRKELPIRQCVRPVVVSDSTRHRTAAPIVV